MGTLEAHGGYNIMQNVGEVEVKGSEHIDIVTLTQ